MAKLTMLDYVALALLVVGGLNWGMVGLLDMNLVERAFGLATLPTKVVYDLVGLAALYIAAVFVNLGRK